MKKIVYIFIIAFLFMTPVLAKDSQLIVIERDNKLYYDTRYLDDKIFMSHLDMVPGGNYFDKLIIENATGRNCKMFFQVKEKEEGQSTKANILLDNIYMKISLNNEVLYDGKVKGLDYYDSGVNLQNAVSLGDFAPSEIKTMEVQTSLSTAYDDTTNREKSLIDWKFYLQYGDDEEEPQPTPTPTPTPTPEPKPAPEPIEILPIPDTVDRIMIYASIFFVSLIAILLLIIYIKNKKDDK